MPVTQGGALRVRPSPPPRCRVRDLLARVPSLRPSGPVGDLTVTGCTHDSRTVQPGDLYAALPGTNVHGASFLDSVVAAGAAAVLTDPAGAELASAHHLLALVVPDPRAVLGEVAACVHGDPADAMLTIGITGTNGKTTTAFLVDAGLRSAGHTTGLIGTVQTHIADEVLPSVRTTPEATDLQGLLAVMRERGVTAAVLEVSSHALALGRVDGIVFDTAVFTNLSQDHLDFHPTMQDYEAAKAALFTRSRSRRGVVNVDDAAGRRLLRTATVPLTTYGEDADVTVHDLDLRPEGSTFRLSGQVDVRVSLALPGDFNVANAAAALTALAVSGVDPAAAVAGMAELPGIPGRMERVEEGQPFLALVDYAHTPEAVQTLLRAVRRVVPGRVIVVLGCGGDRDRAKRPLMGAAAAAGADVTVLTSDNPRSEDPLAILAEMAAGAPNATVEPDRALAIAWAVAQAGAGDAVVVAGKGHETGQEAGGVLTPFDDRQVLRRALRAVGR